MSTILQIANADRNLSSLTKGLKAADLEEVLNGTGPFTIFAPINFAFGRLVPEELFEELIKETNKARLIDILTYHIIAGKKRMCDFIDGQTLKTVNGKDVSVRVNGDEVFINGAKILAKDMQGSNGVVHSLDKVNIPE